MTDISKETPVRISNIAAEVQDLWRDDEVMVAQCLLSGDATFDTPDGPKTAPFQINDYGFIFWDNYQVMDASLGGCRIVLADGTTLKFLPGVLGSIEEKILQRIHTHSLELVKVMQEAFDEHWNGVTL